MESLSNDLYPVYQALTKLAAKAQLFHIDDTGVRILSLISENKKNPERKRTRATHHRFDRPGGRPTDPSLFPWSSNNAGENLADILKQRPKKYGPTRFR